MKFLLGKFSAELTKHVSHLQYPALQVLEGMRGELASAVLAASSLLVGKRAWRLPERLHPLDEAISAVRFYFLPSACCTIGPLIIVNNLPPTPNNDVQLLQYVAFLRCNCLVGVMLVHAAVSGTAHGALHIGQVVTSARHVLQRDAMGSR